MVSVTSFWVVASHDTQIILSSSATGPTERPLPVEIRPAIISTLSRSASLRKRSTVSFALVSSSTTSSTLRPRIPPDALTRSAHHWVVTSAHSPMLPSTPERDARTPTLTGPDCANEGTPASELAASAPPEIFRKSLRLPTDIDPSLLTPCCFGYRARSRRALRLHFELGEPRYSAAC